MSFTQDYRNIKQAFSFLIISCCCCFFYLDLYLLFFQIAQLSAHSFIHFKLHVFEFVYFKHFSSKHLFSHALSQNSPLEIYLAEL